MTPRYLRGNVVVLTFLAIGGFMLSAGCAEIDSGDWQTFVQDLLRNAAAAFLL